MSVPRDPIALEDSLRALQRELGIPSGDLLERVERVWRTVVPGHLGDAAAVRSLRAGRLVVATLDAGIASQLRYCERDVLEACADTVGPGVVVRVDLVVDPGALGAPDA